MTDNLGELKPGKIVLAIALGCAVAWFIYSRFQFKQQPDGAEKTAAIERRLKETQDQATELRKRVEEIEGRLSDSGTKGSRETKSQSKASKGK